VAFAFVIMIVMKNIVISGGSDGLGKALATALAASGNKVFIFSPSQNKLMSVAKKIGCAYQTCDISDWNQVSKAVEIAVNELGSIDVLINNAAVAYGGKVEDHNPADIQRTFDVNVVGTLFLVKAVVPHMKQKGGGYIININSQGGLYAKAERTLYAGSKWALTGITKVLQMELASSKIKVTGLYPGAMEQKMVKNGQKGPQDNSFAYSEMIDAVDFILSRDPGTVIPELGIKNLNN
jgi:3-oxoacyl-[acyl-carrier protein] reductase